MTCDVCQGSKYICVPVALALSTFVNESGVPSSSETVIDRKTFPCPQCCGKQAADERIEIAGVALDVPDYDDASAERFYKDQAARVLASNFLKHASIDFKKTPHPYKPLQFEMTGVVGLVTKVQVNRIEARAKAEAAKIVEEVIEVATRDIETWGSAYTGLDGPIEKRMAVRFIRAAFQKVKEGL
ncbi:hypothetical protein [Agrobacterium tumefaciens]|uniref:hypothetical protein n=1 Tax=Agrobacterium tumefaciens TaxID=358 RepID=UPI0021CF5B33|nr:hypothetical protein [Agrobacterium tumefaciens]UXS01139.1 hypothetical protein FY156_06350 [Agrobacterium tumefaciens]